MQATFLCELVVVQHQALQRAPLPARKYASQHTQAQPAQRKGGCDAKVAVPQAARHSVRLQAPGEARLRGRPLARCDLLAI